MHWVCGKLFIPEQLHRIFFSTRFGRVFDRASDARFRRWRVYADRGSSGAPVAVWLFTEHLTLDYRDEPLARCRVTSQPHQRRLQTVSPEYLCGTLHRPPQRPLWAWGEDEWLPVLRLPAYAPRRSPMAAEVQPPLFSVGEVGV